ncbi:unnamed protein product [Rotaria sp. Silwood2]|nr:unnamed protein product [Rotaria sp. Silwood2]
MTTRYKIDAYADGPIDIAQYDIGEPIISGPSMREQYDELAERYEASKRMPHIFSKLYEICVLNICTDGLEMAVDQSLFNNENSRPLAMYLHHERSVGTHLFCANTLPNSFIVDYLNQNFVLWVYDRTDDVDYKALQTTIRQCIGDSIVQELSLFNIDAYPLLICLSFNLGNYEITKIIKGTMGKDEAIGCLQDARLQFDRRIEDPITNEYFSSIRPTINYDEPFCKFIAITSEDVSNNEDTTVSQSTSTVIESFSNTHLDSNPDTVTSCNEIMPKNEHKADITSTKEVLISTAAENSDKITSQEPLQSISELLSKVNVAEQ